MATIGVDLGGTKTMAVLVEGRVVQAKAKRSTPVFGGPEAVIDTIMRAVTKLDPGGNAVAIGIGMPGPVKPGTGVLPAAPNLPGWDYDVPVGAILTERLGGRPVVVDNDVNVGTLAEHRLGAGMGVDNLLGVFAGTGIGAGLILDGALRRGPRGLTGEIGHSFVAFRDLKSDGPGCGELEDYAGRRSMEQNARWLAEQGEGTVLFDLAEGGRLKSRIWAEAIDAGDALAARLVDEAASALAAAIASAIVLIDLELVVLGGGMAERLGEPFRKRVENEVMERSFTGSSTPVRAARMGDTGGAVGASLLVEDCG
jgi:glucokinase